MHALSNVTSLQTYNIYFINTRNRYKLFKLILPQGLLQEEPIFLQFFGYLQTLFRKSNSESISGKG